MTPIAKALNKKFTELEEINTQIQELKATAKKKKAELENSLKALGLRYTRCEACSGTGYAGENQICPVCGGAKVVLDEAIPEQPAESAESAE